MQLGPRLISLTSLLTWWPTPLPSYPRIPSGLVSMLQTGTCGLSESTGLRKTTRRLPCNVPCLVPPPSLVRLRLSMMTCLLLGPTRPTTLTSAADPLELDLLISVRALFR